MTSVDLFPAHSFSLRLYVALRKELEPHTQRAVADAMGVTEQRVCQLMQGGQNPTVETITRLLMATEKLNRKLKASASPRSPSPRNGA